MFNFGPLEIGALLALALLIFGPKKLPEIGKAIGSAITEFRSSVSGGAQANKNQIPPSPYMEELKKDAAKNEEKPSDPVG